MSLAVELLNGGSLMGRYRDYWAALFTGVTASGLYLLGLWLAAGMPMDAKEFHVLGFAFAVFAVSISGIMIIVFLIRDAFTAVRRLIS
jgi:hypothetical protein